MNRIFFALFAVSIAATTWAQLHWTPPPAAVPVEIQVTGLDSTDPVVRGLAEEVRDLKAAAQPKPSPPRSPMDGLTAALLEKARSSVDLAIKLIGAMAFFLGLMRIAERGGLTGILARALRPLMVRLFPEVPPDHPAMSAMILNISANALGLGNAATPFGLKAMEELDKLNPHKGTATNAMALFMAINTSGLAILPTGVLVWREALGSTRPADVVPTTLFATACSTTVAILAASLYARWARAPADITPPEDDRELPPPERTDEVAAWPLWASALAMAALASLVPLSLLYGRQASPWLVPALVMALLTFGQVRGVPVYEAFIEGAQEGWSLAVRIVPYLVGILCAAGAFQASGALDALIAVLNPFTRPLGLPAEALPMALLRPLSGSGALGVMIDTMSQPGNGPDTYTGLLVSTLQGSTETTFYVLAVYFGSVGITRVRHALAAALTADVAGLIGAVIAVRFVMGA